MSKPSDTSPVLRAIGLMSGTSMDGIDVALIETDGEALVKRIGFTSVAYDDAFRNRLKQSLEDAKPIVARDERPGCLASVEDELTEQHAAAVVRLLAEHGVSATDIDVIAFHGQTVLHRPDQRLTVQIGDGQRLAQLTGIKVVHDLRAADVAAGGQGAPLAPVYHRAMASQLSTGTGSTAVLNIGGVANVTFVAADGELVAFDTGAGNALIDDWVFSRTGDAIDMDGQISSVGVVDQAALAAMMSDGYFAKPPPKSLDRNQFSAMRLRELSVEDGAATLAAFTVEAVAAAERLADEAAVRWIVCGGGRRNATIMKGLRERLAGEVLTAEDVGFDGDAVEAEAWAYLGVRSLRGLTITFPGTTGVEQEMSGGVVAQAG